jgi:putative signal transducing protein
MAEASLVVSNDLEAEMLCGLLRENGIECAYRKTGPAANIGAFAVVGQGGPTEVFVDETRLGEARKLLPE